MDQYFGYEYDINNNITLTVTSYFPSQEPTSKQKPVSNAEPTELPSAQSSLPTDEESAATFEMFIQGAASGGVITQVKNASQEAQPKTKKVNKAQTVGLTRTTYERRQRLLEIARKVENRILNNPEKV